MGTGIADVSIRAGYATHLIDCSDEALTIARQTLEETFHRRVERGRLTIQKAETALALLSRGGDYDEIAGCQLAIETVVEDEEVKREVYKSLCAVLPAESIIATNTSTLSVTRLGANTDRPGRFIGTHFMNPVPQLPLVEVIRGIATDEHTFQLVSEFVVSLGHTPVTVEDFPAFIVHRVLMPMINEAVYALYEGVGSVENIDKAMRIGTQHPMGPLELADFIGLDTCLQIMHTLHEGLADTKYRPCPLLVKYVEAGWIGRKAGRGFYDYSGPEPVPTR